MKPLRREKTESANDDGGGGGGDDDDNDIWSVTAFCAHKLLFVFFLGHLFPSFTNAGLFQFN
jgi:hypothetical protein